MTPDTFFNKIMPIYAVFVCIACFLMLGALGLGLLIGLIARVFS